MGAGSSITSIKKEAKIAKASLKSANVELEESKSSSIKPNIQEAKTTMTNTKPKPSFETLISFQLTEGKWDKNCEANLKDYFTDSNIEDPIIEAVLAQAKSDGSSADPMMIHFTLIALYILKETFDMKKQEWLMIAKKAKEWLKSVKVTNADKYIKKLNLSLKP